MRTVFVIRHGQSEGNRYNRAAFGKKGGSLIKAGIQEAKQLKGALAKLGVDVTDEPVAVSELQRTSQTASYAGFTRITEYSILNEINSGLSAAELEGLLELQQLPVAATEAARAVLSNPPPEKVWVTHGLLIAALAHELGIPPEEIFIPKMGSVTKLIIS